MLYSLRHDPAGHRAVLFPLRRWATLLATLAAAMQLAAAARAEASTASRPSPAKALALTYEVYAGGMHIFTFDVDLSLRPGGYRLAAEGGTRGMAGFLYKWDVRLMADGAAPGRLSSAAVADQLRPRRYDTMTDWKDKPKTMELAFGPAGSYVVTRDPPEPIETGGDGGDLPAKLPPDIVDPLSAALVATQRLAETGRCQQTVPVFDGKRRYNLRIDDVGYAQLPKSRYSAYHGPAVQCGFTMERISGFKKKRRYASQWDEDKDEPPVLWLARVREDLPPVPVRFTGAIALGSIIVHLTKVEARTEVASTD